MTITTTITVTDLDDGPVVWGDDLVDIGGLGIVGDPHQVAAALRRCADRVDAAMRPATLPGFHAPAVVEVGLLSKGDRVAPLTPHDWAPPPVGSPEWVLVVDVCPVAAGGPPSSVFTPEFGTAGVWRHSRAMWAMRAHRHDQDAATYEIGPAA